MRGAMLHIIMLALTYGGDGPFHENNIYKMKTKKMGKNCYRFDNVIFRLSLRNMDKRDPDEK